MKNNEQWADIFGYEDMYEVSSFGNVRDKRTLKIKKTYLSNDKYSAVTLYNEGKSERLRVHRLVAKAFIPNTTKNIMVLHRDDDGTNNKIENLYWGNKADNTNDAIRNGKHPHANKTHCKRGHEFTENNTKKTKQGRSCRACIKIRENN